MRNLKQVMATLLALSMVGATVAGCNSAPKASSSSSASASASVSNSSSASKAAEGKDLTIYCWNDEFKGMLEKYYLKDKPLPADVKLNIVINPNDGGVYQQKLDQALQAGEKIDMFLIEADYAKKYVNTEYSVPISNIGIKESELKDQYQYTVDVAKDTKGSIKALAWQAAPGLFMYRRSLAQKFLGVKTTDEMQNLVKDWPTFIETAKKVNKASAGKTKLLPSTEDVWQVFRSNRATSWVENGKLSIAPEVDNFLELAKTLQSEKVTADAEQWSEAWNAGLGNDSIMGYFFSTWGIQWTMVKNCKGTKPGEGTYGDWAAINGPQSYYWGGTWLTPCKFSDNNTLVADIIRYFTVNKDSMKNYCLASKDYVNNKTAITEITTAGYKFDFLGGQDHYSLFQKAADKVDTKTMTGYDQEINIAFKQAFLAYSKGEKSKDDALKQFKAAVADKFPDIQAK